MFHLNNNELLSSTVLQICDAAGEQGTKRNSMVVDLTINCWVRVSLSA